MHVEKYFVEIGSDYTLYMGVLACRGWPKLHVHCTYLSLFQHKTYLAISVKPQEAVACKGVQPSLSQTSTSAECLTKNSTISKLSSIHAYKQIRNVTQICHFRLILI